jgi:hypothetical protein
LNFLFWRDNCIGLQGTRRHNPRDNINTLFRRVRRTAEKTINFVMSVLLPSVRPSVRMEKPGSHRTDFDEISYLHIFRRSVEKIQVSLKSDKNNGYFPLRPTYIYASILLNSLNKEYFKHIYRQCRNTHFMIKNVFLKIVPFIR